MGSVGKALLGGKGAACAEMVDRATKPAQVIMMMRMNVRSRIAERLFRCVWYIIPHFPERSRFKSIASMSEKIRDHDRQDPTAKLGPLWGQAVGKRVRAE